MNLRNLAGRLDRSEMPALVATAGFAIIQFCSDHLSAFDLGMTPPITAGLHDFFRLMVWVAGSFAVILWAWALLDYGAPSPSLHKGNGVPSSSTIETLCSNNSMERGTEVGGVTIPEDLERYREDAEKLANSMYKPHRFGDAPAWFDTCVRLAQQRLFLEEQIAHSKPLGHTEIPK